MACLLRLIYYQLSPETIKVRIQALSTPYVVGLVVLSVKETQKTLSGIRYVENLVEH